MKFIKDIFRKIPKANLKEDINGYQLIECGYDIMTIKRYFPKADYVEGGGIVFLSVYLSRNLTDVGYEIIHQEKGRSIFKKLDNFIIMSFKGNFIDVYIRKKNCPDHVLEEVLEGINRFHYKMIKK